MIGYLKSIPKHRGGGVNQSAICPSPGQEQESQPGRAGTQRGIGRMLVSPESRSASIIWKSAIDWLPVMSIDAVRAKLTGILPASPADYREPLCTTIRPFLVFYVRFSCSHFHKVLVRYRYRSYPAFPIASSDIDSERTTITGCGSAALYYYPAISCFLCTFPGL